MATPSLLPKKATLFPPQFGDALQPELTGADPAAPMPMMPGTPENSFAAYAANPLNHAKLPPTGSEQHPTANYSEQGRLPRRESCQPYRSVPKFRRLANRFSEWAWQRSLTTSAQCSQVEDLQ
jgi:hypothetical protein